VICVGDQEVWSVSVYSIREISGKTGMVGIHVEVYNSMVNHIQSNCQTHLKSIHGLSSIEFDNRTKSIYTCTKMISQSYSIERFISGLLIFVKLLLTIKNSKLELLW